MFIFIVWLLLAVLVGKYAESNGRGFGAWLAISLIFSPLLGFLFALVAGKAN